MTDKRPPPLSFVPTEPPPAWVYAGAGHFPWDHWERKSLAAGMPEELAQLGRATYREASNHDRAAKLRAECGWDDEGAAMIERARSDPDAARARWTKLLATDGGQLDQTNDRTKEPQP